MIYGNGHCIVWNMFEIMLDFVDFEINTMMKNPRMGIDSMMEGWIFIEQETNLKRKILKLF